MITGPTSYVLALEQFINHWGDVNSPLGANPLILKKEALGTTADVARADLEALQELLLEKRGDLETVLLDAAIARGEALILKAWLHDRMVEFNEAVRADLGQTVFARLLTDVPNLKDGREAFMRPMRNSLGLWARINAYLAANGGEELKALGDVTQLQFGTKLGELRAKYATIEEREQEAALERERRNELQDRIYPIFKAYRLKVPTVFPADSPLVQTLPLITPVPGATPQAPGLAGVWNAAETRADLTGTASTSASVVKHQLRGCASEEYNSDDEAVVETIEGSAPLLFPVTFGLTQPGEVASFRLYAITADGHEAASETIVISRPL